MDLRKKKESSGNAEDIEQEYGRTWIWTAIDAPSRLLITFWIGGRELIDARQMLQNLASRSQAKPLFVSDELPHYATVHKTRESGRVVQVDRRVVYGSEQSVRDRLADSPSHKINTAYIERSNLNWRLWDAHLVRKSLTFARSLRWLRAKFAIVVSCYNLIRPHGTLSRGADRVFRPTTPAMAADVTDHLWTFGELLAYPATCQ